ncbi:MAG: YbaB/EbfC family nucleoid-associated protein [Acidimicrobiia bacterium]
MAKQKPAGGQGAQLNQMMRQMQKMQEDMAAAQSALAEETAEVSAGGGMIKAVVTGSGEIRSVSIDRQVVDPDDLEMLEDLVLAICKEAQRAAQALQAERMGAVAGGLDLGALDGLIG